MRIRRGSLVMMMTVIDADADCNLWIYRYVCVFCLH